MYQRPQMSIFTLILSAGVLFDGTFFPVSTLNLPKSLRNTGKGVYVSTKKRTLLKLFLKILSTLFERYWFLYFQDIIFF